MNSPRPRQPLRSVLAKCVAENNEKKKGEKRNRTRQLRGGRRGIGIISDIIHYLNFDTPYKTALTGEHMARAPD
ncbi:hypothetical protein EVAR_62610_1 [Eumeta japonica]|uniref:Uncharacterized protein n=1 Tax=Eumeta variegata TaxID=151549 RepID=A0A4C1ZEQ0_EUMVA|nr:hypothetical protein EVAR_62610_1 [Eumeta japonica]